MLHTQQIRMVIDQIKYKIRFVLFTLHLNTCTCIMYFDNDGLFVFIFYKFKPELVIAFTIMTICTGIKTGPHKLQLDYIFKGNGLFVHFSKHAGKLVEDSR